MRPTKATSKAPSRIACQYRSVLVSVMGIVTSKVNVAFEKAQLFPRNIDRRDGRAGIAFQRIEPVGSGPRFLCEQMAPADTPVSLFHKQDGMRGALRRQVLQAVIMEHTQAPALFNNVRARLEAVNSGDMLGERRRGPTRKEREIRSSSDPHGRLGNNDQVARPGSGGA